MNIDSGYRAKRNKSKYQRTETLVRTLDFEFLVSNAKSKQRKYIIWIIPFMILSSFFSCEDFVAIDPPKSELVSETVYANDENATAAIRGIYRELARIGFAHGGLSSVTILGGLSADELDAYSSEGLVFYTNELLSEDSNVFSNWQSMYQAIYRANAVLEGLANSTGVSPEVSVLLEGEAKFIRAFCYFYLVNLWGEVPLVTGTDFEKNRLASRSPVSQIYELILEDLQEAQELLPEDYTHAGGERIRVNVGAASALLARVYLYLEDWGNAEVQATETIGHPSYMLAEDLKAVFLKNSTEAIWQLKPVFGGNTNEGQAFILTAPPTFVALSDNVVNAFETEDKRKTDWTNSFTDDNGTWFYPFKYKVRQESDPANVTEYSMVLRLVEQYLIRAEARAQQGNITGAQEDLNRIRHRVGLENTTATTQTELLDAILQERQRELFTEWAHRWLDLKRTGLSDAVLGAIKPTWQPTAILWPIPQSERDGNPNLEQNEGYQ